MAAHNEKPIIILTAFAAGGHVAGATRISEHLVSQGFEVYLITGVEFRNAVEKTGARFVENSWKWMELMAKAPPGREQAIFVMKYVFGDSTPVAHRVLKELLERLRREQPNREVVILHESLSGAIGPFVHGAPLPEGYSSLPKVVVYHTSVYGTKHEKLPPHGPGLSYDPTPENLVLWRSMSETMKPTMDGIMAHYDKVYKSLGATRTVEGSFFDMIMNFGDVLVLATSPSLEYPVPVHNPKLRFIGGLPLKPLDPAFAFPDWWPTITANAALPASSPERKKVVFVTQGTVHVDYTELLLPTINALADRDDVIVVGTLGVRGGKLDDAAAKLPANTIVTDYLPYDALLPYADAFVSNAGYGGFMHGVMNGVPMVLAGMMADKAEVCARAEYAGVAINLRAQKPEEEAIRAAVDRVLAEPKFKERAAEVKRENEELDAFGTLERIVGELAGGQ